MGFLRRFFIRLLIWQVFLPFGNPHGITPKPYQPWRKTQEDIEDNDSFTDTDIDVSTHDFIKLDSTTMAPNISASLPDEGLPAEIIHDPIEEMTTDGYWNTEETESFTGNTTEITLVDGRGMRQMPHMFFMKDLKRALIAGVPPLLGVVGNSLTLAAFAKSDTLRKPANYLICNLAVNDMIFSIIQILTFVSGSITIGQTFILSHKYACLTTLFFISVGMTSSLLSMLAISAERLFAVMLPLKHLEHMTGSVVRRIIISVWLVTFGMCLPVYFSLDVWKVGSPCKPVYVYPYYYHLIIYLALPVAAFVALCVLNSIIASVAYRKRKPQANVPSGAQPTVSLPQKTKLKNQNKITKMLVTVVGVFTVLSAPYVITLTLLAVYNLKGEMPSPSLVLAQQYSKIIMSVSLFVNPIIYGGQSPLFRQGYKKLFKC